MIKLNALHLPFTAWQNPAVLAAFYFIRQVTISAGELRVCFKLPNILPMSSLASQLESILNFQYEKFVSQLIFGQSQLSVSLLFNFKGHGLNES